MKLPIDWLKDYVDIDESPEALSDRLTFSGTEVEGLETVEGGVVLTIEVTPNRPDCLSMIGMAREVAALYGRALRIPEIALPEGEEPVADRLAVDVEDAAGCPRYSARRLNGVTIGPSPEWMQRRLIQCDVRPINNLVDITNYVLMECGQPLHAFDAARLGGDRIRVRRAAAGEKIVSLDDVERALTPEMLVIADAEHAVAIAGVMGGAGSEIDDATQDVVLESAAFDASDVRRTSKQLGLATESSYRFERGVDIANVEWASRRAAALIVELTGAVSAAGVIDLFPGGVPAVSIACNYDHVRRLMGSTIGNDEINTIFGALSFAVAEETGQGCIVSIPSFRIDLDIEADLIEEVARVYGLDRLETPPPRARIVPGADDEPARATAACRSTLAGLGLSEVMHYSFLAQQQLDRVDPGDREQRICLPNPISQDHDVLRTSLLPQMIEALGRNRARQIMTAAFFEVGRVFRKVDGAYMEDDQLAIGLMGPAGRGSFARRQPFDGAEMFCWVKGIFEALCAANHVGSVELVPARRVYLEEGQAADITIDGVHCGCMGIVHESVRSEWRLTEPVGVLECRLHPMTARIFHRDPLQKVSPYPPVMRDVAVIVDQAVKNEQILEEIRRCAPLELTRLELFDIYTGQGIGEGRKSLAYSLTYQSSEATLTDETVNEYHEAIKAGLVTTFAAEIRGNE